MGLVAQYQQGAFSSPANGQDGDATVVLANDNNIRSKHNSHDADATIHLQTSTLAARAAAGVAGRPWATTDGLRVYIDSGTAWQEIDYLNKATGGTVTGATTFSNGVTVTTGGITVSAGTTAVQAITGTSLALTSSLTMATQQQLRWADANNRISIDTAATTFTLLVNGANVLTSLGQAVSLYGPLTLTSTTASQLNVRYDASNHLAIDVSAGGIVTYTATGAGAAHVFPNRLRTASGTQSASDSVATTLFALPGAGMYKVLAYIANAGSIYLAEATYGHDGTNARLIEANNGANMSLTLSGTNVQGTQISGGVNTITYAYLRIA